MNTDPKLAWHACYHAFKRLCVALPVTSKQRHCIEVLISQRIPVYFDFCEVTLEHQRTRCDLSGLLLHTKQCVVAQAVYFDPATHAYDRPVCDQFHLDVALCTVVESMRLLRAQNLLWEHYREVVETSDALGEVKKKMKKALVGCVRITVRLLRHLQKQGGYEVG